MNRSTLRVQGWSRRRKLALLGVVALVVVAAAVAAWLVSGSGSGSARAGQLSPLIVSAVPFASGTGDLYPGQTGTLRFQVSNNNASALILTTVNGGGSGATSNPACPFSNVSVVPQSGLSIPLPGNADTVVTIAGGISMSSAAPSACQDTAFTPDVTVTATTP